MNVAKLIQRKAETVPPTASCQDAARRMRDIGVGSLVVVENNRPLGVVTDRDLVLRAVAPGLVSACAERRAHALALGALSEEPSAAERARFDRELRVAVRRNGMRLLGPDSCGVINSAPGIGLCTVPLARAPARGRIGLACDSRARALELLVGQELAAVGLSSFAGLGRRADVSANDLLQYWEEDAATGVVGLAVDSAGNPRKLERIAARVAAAKPLVALGSSGEHAALLRAAGAEVVGSPAELAARLRALA